MIDTASKGIVDFFVGLFSGSDLRAAVQGGDVHRIKKQGIRFDDEQWGNKAGQHAKDWGLDPSKAEDRQWLKDKTVDIFSNADDVITGPWRGLGEGGKEGPARFFVKGNDVVVTDMENNFVTILKDGINNKRVINGVSLQ